MVSAASRWRLARAAILAAAGALAAGPALAQYAASPFLDDPIVQSQAFGLESVAQRLRIVEAFDPPLEEDLMEQVEKMAGGDFARFGGTLAGRNPELAEALLETLEEIAEEVEEGKDVVEMIGEARELLAEAYDVVIDPAVRETPAFKGGVLADLLLAEGGVAEGYEEAVEELWEFPNGWAALQRVKELWSEVGPLATDARRADGDEMITALDALYPEAAPPQPFVGRNPEEAEAPSQRLLGIVEEATAADLYPGRDLILLAGRLGEVLVPSCEAYESGDDEIGAEGSYAVFGLYNAHLADLLELFAPEVHEEIGELFGNLVVVEEEDDEGEGAGDDRDEEPLPAGEACRGLIEEFAEARTALGG